MQTFWYHHQHLYQKLLWLSLITILALGLINLRTRAISTSKSPKIGLAGADWSAFRLTKPAPSSIQVTKTATVKPPNQAQPQPAPTQLPPYGGPLDSPDALTMAKLLSDARFGPQHWSALYNLWSRESGWRPWARNSTSGACGIPQALPCSKIHDMSTPGQIEWGLNYIANRYGNPSNAWRFWQSHRWY
jgi:hypothetical protein